MISSILTSVKSPVWSNAEHTTIDCIITTSQFGEQELPFTASQTDVEAHGRAIFQDLVDGKYGSIAEYVPPPVEEITAINATEGGVPITVM